MLRYDPPARSPINGYYLLTAKTWKPIKQTSSFLPRAQIGSMNRNGVCYKGLDRSLLHTSACHATRSRRSLWVWGSQRIMFDGYRTGYAHSGGALNCSKQGIHALITRWKLSHITRCVLSLMTNFCRPGCREERRRQSTRHRDAATLRSARDRWGPGRTS